MNSFGNKVKCKADSGDTATVQTYLSQAVGAVGSNAQYDENVKQLLADKQVLAWILKYAVREFNAMELEDIASGIDGKIEIGKAPLDPGQSVLGKITGDNTEDNVVGEGKIVYDIRFTVRSGKEDTKFLINVEAQKSTDPASLGYHLENRIVYYLSRMVSAQKHVEFYHSDYDQLKRVRSIWICMDGGSDKDSIEEISLQKDTVFGNGSSGEIDLIRAVVIHIRSGRRAEESKNKLIAMLEVLLSQMKAEEKKKALTEHGMIMTEEMEGKVNSMCNLSEIVYEEGMEKGMEKGRLDMIRELIASGRMTLGEGAEIFGISVEEMKEKVEKNLQTV